MYFLKQFAVRAFHNSPEQANCKVFILIEKNWPLDKPFWKYRPSNIFEMLFFTFETDDISDFKIKLSISGQKCSKCLFFGNHSISSMNTNELNLFISYITVYYTPAKMHHRAIFMIDDKFKLKTFRQIQLISL